MDICLTSTFVQKIYYHILVRIPVFKISEIKKPRKRWQNLLIQKKI